MSKQAVWSQPVTSALARILLLLRPSSRRLRTSTMRAEIIPSFSPCVAILTGPTEDIAHFCARLIRVPDEATEVTLDFDRIIPMPGILKGTGDAGADLGIEI